MAAFILNSCRVGLLLFVAIVVQWCSIGSLEAGQSIQEKFEHITAKQMKRYNIAHAEWRGTYGFIVGCYDCAGAKYDSQSGALLNPAELAKIPTSWTLRVPSEWNGKAVVVVPPGNLDQVAAYTNLAFPETLLNEQFAVAIMNHPSPGFPGFPYLETSDSPYSASEYRVAYFLTSYIIKFLIWEIFDRPEAYYGVGTSRGTSLGMGMLLDEPLSAFDGYVVALGGNGYEGSMEGFQEAYRSVPPRMPLTGVPLLQVSATQKVDRILFFLGTVDPEYQALIQSAATSEERLERALAYDVAAQPRKIQKLWDSIAMGAKLRRPTIVIQGLRERTVPLTSPLSFFQRVEDARRQGLLRIYFIKDAAHVQTNDPPGIPRSTFLDGIAKLDAWVQDGVEPGPLNISPYTPNNQPSCTTLGLSSLDCFCEVLEDGVGGFCSEDSSVACGTANPAKPFFPPVPPLFIPVPDDNCVALGKGVCVPEVPPECG